MIRNTSENRKVQGVSFEPDVLAAAKRKAAKGRQSLSAYINAALVADLGCELSATITPLSTAFHGKTNETAKR